MRTMGQHVRDVFTLADKPQLLTDPDPTPEQAAKIAESAQFYLVCSVAFGLFWTANSIYQLVRNQGDDRILGSVGLAVVIGMGFAARKYYLRMREWSRRV